MPIYEFDQPWDDQPEIHREECSSPEKQEHEEVPAANVEPTIDPKNDSLEAAFFNDFDQILMTQSVYQEARDYFKSCEPEAACLLLGPKNDEIITHIIIDNEGKATPVSFTLAAASLNRKAKPCIAAGMDIKGVKHLHPPGFTSLSFGDIEYARKLFANPKHRGLVRFVMPITAGNRFYGFVLTRTDKVLAIRPARLVLV